jgi:hypothetical protein
MDRLLAARAKETLAQDPFPATTLVFRATHGPCEALWDVKKPALFKVPAQSDVVRPVVRSILSALLRRGPALAARC